MRILFWSERFRPDVGGVEVWSANLIAALQAHGHHCLAVAACTPAAPEGLAEFGAVRVHRFPFHGALLRRDLAAIGRITRDIAALEADFRPDILHVNTSQPSLLFLERVGKPRGCHWIFTVHEPISIRTTRNSLLYRTLMRADWVVGISAAMLDDARRLAPEITDRSSLIRNATVDSLNADRRVEPDPFEILCAGRLVPEKGFDVAIRAFSRVHGVLPRSRLTIAGDGPERDRLSSLAAECGVGPHIHMTGPVTPEAVSVLATRSALVAVPSTWREPFGLIALQAAEAGRPVVASNVGGLPEVVLDGRTGLLVPPDDEAALADAMLRLLRSPDLARRLGEAARSRRRESFAYTDFVDHYERLYRRIGGS